MTAASSRTEPREIAVTREIHGPEWRWREAQRRMAAQKPPWPLPDRLVGQLTVYLGLKRRSLPDAARRFPRLAAAEQVHQQPALAERLRLMVAAQVPPEQIAARLAIATEIVQLYEAIFFDVRQHLHQGSWIVIHVLHPLEKSGNFQLSARFRAALSGGTAVLDALLSDEIDFPVTFTEQMFKKRTHLMALESEAISVVPLDRESAWKFVQMGARWRIESRRIELAEKRLDAKCLAAARDFELKRQKLEVEKLDAESRLWLARSQAQSTAAENPPPGKSGAARRTMVNAGTQEDRPRATRAVKSA